MNKHFHDSRYYLTRAAEHARLGVTDALEAPTNRVRALLGRDDPDPEPSRLEGVLMEATALERRAVARTRGTVDSVQERLVVGDSSEPADDR